MWIPFSLSLLSICLFAASTVVIARAIFRVVPSAAYFGSNPHAIKSSLLARAEATAGITFVVLGLIAGIVGEAEERLEVSLFIAPEWVPLPNLITALLLSLVVIVMGITFADFAVRSTVRRRLIEAKRPSWQHNGYIVKHDGEYRNQKEEGLTREIRDQRMQSALEQLADIESVLDLKTLPDVKARISRLETIFDQ